MAMTCWFYVYLQETRNRQLWAGIIWGPSLRGLARAAEWLKEGAHLGHILPRVMGLGPWGQQREAGHRWGTGWTEWTLQSSSNSWGLACSDPTPYPFPSPPSIPPQGQQHSSGQYHSVASVLVTPFPSSHGIHRLGLGFCQHLEIHETKVSRETPSTDCEQRKTQDSNRKSSRPSRRPCSARGIPNP